MPGFSGAAPRDREYLFIDGGSLRSAVSKISADIFGDARAFEPLVASLAGGRFDKVFYYDAVPGIEHGEAQAAYEQRVQPDYERFARIQALDRVHVALGRIVGQKRRQKGVDVQLAVDMMTHAFRGNIRRATLFAGDADFVPLLSALVAEGLHVTLWHPPQANAELKGAADSVRLFDFRADHNCFTRDGRQPAFQLSSSGSGAIQPSDHGLSKVVSQDGAEFAGRWRDDTLTVWRREAGGGWSYVTFVAPGSELKTALVAFEHIYTWPIAATGDHWVEV